MSSSGGHICRGLLLKGVFVEVAGPVWTKQLISEFPCGEGENDRFCPASLSIVAVEKFADGHFYLFGFAGVGVGNDFSALDAGVKHVFGNESSCIFVISVNNAIEDFPCAVVDAATAEFAENVFAVNNAHA